MQEMHVMTIGERIAAARQVRGWSQKALAEHLGVDQATISRIENGDGFGPRPWQRARAQRLADLLALPFDDLVESATPPEAA